MRLVRKPITIVNRMTTIGSVAKIRAVSAFGSMYAEIYSGSAMNSCQKTIQYPVKISRKIMNCGFEHSKEVLAHLAQACGLAFFGAARLLEEQQHDEEHKEHAQRSNAKYALHFSVLLRPGGKQRSPLAPHIHQRAVDRISHRTDIFLQRPTPPPHP